jgi:hypothetical protein
MLLLLVRQGLCSAARCAFKTLQASRFLLVEIALDQPTTHRNWFSSIQRSSETAAASKLGLECGPSNSIMGTVVSRSTSRSTTTAYRPSLPLPRATDVAGGYWTWQAAGLPTARPGEHAVVIAPGASFAFGVQMEVSATWVRNRRVQGSFQPPVALSAAMSCG